MWHHRASDGHGRGRAQGGWRGCDRAVLHLRGELSRLYRSRELSPVEVTDAALARIEREPVPGHLPDGDRRPGPRAGEGLRGQGAPWRADWPAGRDPVLAEGSGADGRHPDDVRVPWFVDHVPTEDGTVAARLKRIRRRLVGQDQHAELATRTCANMIGPPCSNPWRLDRRPGACRRGRLGGGGWLGPIAHGSDGAGRPIPAALCRIFGLASRSAGCRTPRRPTYSRRARTTAR